MTPVFVHGIIFLEDAVLIAGDVYDKAIPSEAATRMLDYFLSELANRKTYVYMISGNHDSDERLNYGKIDIELIPLKPMRNLRHIEGTLRELLNKSNVKSTEDFIYATLTDEEIINDAMGIFQQVYPNTVKIDYNNSHTKEIEQLDISKIAENRSFAELISDFYKQMYNQEISTDEMDVMRSVAKEAVETYVDFYFTHQGKSYHVKRRPEYERQKMHGSGVTLIKKLKCLVSESCCLHKTPPR